MYQKSSERSKFSKFALLNIIIKINKGISAEKIQKNERNKMLSIVKSMALNGINGYLVDVQIDVSAGLPHWEIVRLARYSSKRIERKG